MADTPLWETIHAALARDIAAGRYAPGDRLPTEAALAARFGVNRHTVRRALARLADEGRVRSRRGSGVFVIHRPTEYPIGRRVRFHQNLRAAGRTPARRSLSFETRCADAREAEALKLAPGAHVHVYEGLSLADGQPIALFRSVFPAARLPLMPQALQEDASVTAAFARHGIDDYTRAFTRVDAKLAGATQARHLEVTEGAPLLRTTSVNVDASGQPLEYGKCWFAADRVALTLTES